MEPTEDPKASEKPPEDPRGAITAFFRDARRLFQKHDLESSLWITKKGVFVESSFTSTVVEVFSGWFQERVGSDVAYSVEKAERKLFEDEVRKEFYLVIGSSVVVGNLIECASPELRSSGLRIYEGMPLDTASNLHHTDPVFLESDELAAALTKTGYAALVRTRKGEFVVPFDLLPKLREFFIQFGEMRKYIHPKNLRTLLRTFAKSLGHVHPLNKQYHVLLPSRVAQAGDPRLWVMNSICIIEHDGVIRDFFPLRGKAREVLVREELQHLAAGTGRVGGARIELMKGSFLGQVDIMGIAHRFGVSAVLSFVDMFEEYSGRNRGRLPGRVRSQFMIQDAVSELVFLLRDSAPCLSDKIPPRVREFFHPDAAVLVSKGEWFFSVDRVKMVRAAAYAARVQRKQIAVVPRPEHS